MADITREVGDVNPNNYIKPGVQKPSPLSLAADLGSQAIDLDVALSKERLAKESEDLRTRYEIGSPASIAVQEGMQLTEGDKAQVDAVGAELQKKQAAVAQGRMTFDRYRLEGERLLRMAIAKRPGLAQEFRGVAAQHLGVDVVGASVDILADAERALEAAGKKDKGGPDFKRMRDQLDSIGVVNAFMSDDQVLAAYGQNTDAVYQMLQQKAQSEVVTTQAATQEAGNKLRRPGATAAFVSEAQKNKLEIYKNFSQAFAAYKSGNPDFMKNLPQILVNGQADISGRVSSLRAAMAQGDVNPDIAEKEIAGLEELGRQMTELASGKLSADVLDNKLRGTMLFMQNSMMDNDNVATLAAATKTFSPEIMTQFVQPGGAFNKTAMLALGDTLNNTGRPLTRASNAGTVASSVLASVLDRGGGKSNPEQIPAMGQTLINAANSFVEIEPKDFRSDYLTGPNGYLTVLGFHAQSLSKTLGEDQKNELLGSVSIAALSNFHALAVAIGTKFPSFKGKLEFGLDTSTGEFVKPKAGVRLTPTEQAALRSYNKAFDGKKVLGLFQTLGGVDAETAKNLLFSGEAVYQEAKKASKSATPKQSGTVGTLSAMGEEKGFRVTSTTRTPEENKKDKGVANSKHLVGEAVDFSIKGKTKEEIADFVSALKEAGYQVVSTPHGTGPHIHAEKD